MEKMTIIDIEVADKRVLVRIDLNFPLDENTGNIIEDGRIRAVIPTIRYLIERGAKIIL
jgi:phosphoglycerate kinase